MDFTSIFLETFVCLHFNSFKELKLKINEFQQLTGLSYKMRRSNKFDRRFSEFERNILQYRALTFACKNYRNKEQPCGSVIDIRSTSDYLNIARFCMLHNHDIENEVKSNDVYWSDYAHRLTERPSTSINGLDASQLEYCSVADTTTDFLNVFRSCKFPTFTDLQAKMNEFQEATGSLYVIRNSNLFPIGNPCRDTLRYRTLRYVCYHYGKYESGASVRLKQKTSKIECTSLVSISVSNGRLKIVRYNMKHTHPVTPELASFYPKRRKLQHESPEYISLSSLNPCQKESDSASPSFQYNSNARENAHILPKNSDPLMQLEKESNMFLPVQSQEWQIDKPDRHSQSYLSATSQNTNTGSTYSRNTSSIYNLAYTDNDH